ncbi:MAG: T9SS type A sorting domain-containing protein [Bacteroidetes bacterium]|nr:T9SS type A sorting domain-containing protein [Bacteroidota bacterium]
MKKLFKTGFLLLVIVITTAASAFSQDNYKNTRTEHYRIPILPSVYKYLGVHDNPNSVLKQDFWITLRDNVQLDASKFYPSEANPYLPNGYPVVIMVHGYGDRKETLENFAQAQASYGYVVYTFSVRGQGNSGGLSNLISRTEAQDLIEVVNYVKRDNINTGSDSSRILITGGSQGGTLPYMAASMGMKVKAIISALTSPVLGTSWIENGCVKMTFLWTIEYTPDTARYTPLVDRMSNWVYGGTQANWDSLARWVPQDRDFNTIIKNNTVPIMLENSWQDMFFNVKGNIDGIPSMTAPSRYYFGAVMGHGGDTSPTEDTWHMNFFNEWYFYWLFDIQNDILTRPKYHFAYTTFPETSGMWSFQHDSSTVFPPAGMSNLRLYFNSSNKLKKTVNSNQSSTVTLTTTVKSGYNLTKAVDDEFKGTTFKTNFKKDSVVFNSDPLTANAKIIGTPTLKLDYQSNINQAQYNMQIFEVRSDGYAKFISSINYTDRKHTKSRTQKTISGNSFGHIFQAGSRIRVILTNLDQRWNYPFLGTNPYVLPVVQSSANKMYLSSNSYIDFPLVGTTSPLGKSLASELGTIGTADVFALSQNYPNPFNPVTRISFNLPKDFSGNVTLKIYDMTGKEVADLVNEHLTTGLFEVKWDASKYSTGIYFYKLTAGTFSEVRKMILVK